MPDTLPQNDNSLPHINRQRPQTIDEIDGASFYLKVDLVDVFLPRGRSLSEALRNDPMAPQYQTLSGRNAKAKFYLGADVIRYANSAYDDVSVLEKRITQKALENAHKYLETARAAIVAERQELKAERERIASNNLLALTASINRHLSNAKLVKFFPASQKSGVYFLKQEKTIVYIGQSVAVGARISSHMMGGSKQFDEVVIFYCDPTELDNWEGFFIRLLRPKYNGGVGKDLKNLSAPRSALWLKVEAWQLNDCEAPADV